MFYKCVHLTFQKQGKIPLHLTYEDDAILSISKNNIKITRRDGAEVNTHIYIYILQFRSQIKHLAIHIDQIVTEQ